MVMVVVMVVLLLLLLLWVAVVRLLGLVVAGLSGRPGTRRTRRTGGRKVALGVGVAVVEQTLGAADARHGVDGRTHAVRRVLARTAPVLLRPERVLIPSTVPRQFTGVSFRFCNPRTHSGRSGRISNPEKQSSKLGMKISNECNN